MGSEKLLTVGRPIRIVTGGYAIGMKQTCVRRRVVANEGELMPKPARKLVMIFLDTDKHVSPFDVLTAVDLFPEAQILTYGNVTVEDFQSIIHDAIFPRGPDGATQTKLFIGGYDVEKAAKILEIAKKSMYPPFELVVIADPRGAYTTASAAVAKTLLTLAERKLGDFKGKAVTILAGTGPVGQTAARLYAMEGARVAVSSRDLAKSTAIASRIEEGTGRKQVRGVKAVSPQEIGEAIKDSHVVLSAGAAGIALLPRAILDEFGKQCRVVADINAIPPLGVEGLNASDEGVEFAPGVWGIGALAIGSFKNKIEVQLLKKAVESPKGTFDYKAAYEIAKSMVLEKLGKTKQNQNPSESGRNLLPF